MTALLEAREVSVSFRRPRGEPVRALAGVSLRLERGESVGLIGESGSGKSTMVRLLTGLLRPDSGAVLFDGAPLSATFRRRRDRSRRVQMIFQDAAGALNPRLTARQTLAEALIVHGRCRAADPKALDARIAGLLERVGLPPAVLAQVPAELSGGQCQRICIARALAPEPEVLIADEPVSALDVSVQARILNLLAELRASLGLTVLLVAHDLAVVRAVCDRAVVLRHGMLVEQGDVQEVLARPQHPYTRELLAAAGG